MDTSNTSSMRDNSMSTTGNDIRHTANPHASDEEWKLVALLPEILPTMLPATHGASALYGDLCDQLHDRGMRDDGRLQNQICRALDLLADEWVMDADQTTGAARFRRTTPAERDQVLTRWRAAADKHQRRSEEAQRAIAQREADRQAGEDPANHARLAAEVEAAIVEHGVCRATDGELASATGLSERAVVHALEQLFNKVPTIRARYVEAPARPRGKKVEAVREIVRMTEEEVAAEEAEFRETLAAWEKQAAARAKKQAKKDAKAKSHGFETHDAWQDALADEAGYGSWDDLCAAARGEDGDEPDEEAREVLADIRAKMASKVA